MIDETPCRPDREEMQHDWAARAPYWIERAPEIAEMAENFNAPLLDAADIAAGESVLDLASGAGEPALSIVRRVRPEALVVATDLVPDMLAGLARRGLAVTGSAVPMAAADMQAMPFRDAAFDRVVCRFGLMFVPDPGLAFREVARVLSPGGRTAFLVWGPVEHNSLFQALRGVGRQIFGPDVADDMLTMNRFAANGSVVELMTAAGLLAAEEREIDLVRRVPVDAPFWHAPLDMAFGHRFEVAGGDAKSEFIAALPEALAPYRDGDAYEFRVHVRIAVADAPA